MIISMRRITLLISVAVVFLTPGIVSADWPQFRGPNSDGIYKGKPVPTEFGPGVNELWSIPLRSGHSSPCIAGSSIFLPTFDRETRKLAVVCIQRLDGKIRWRRDVPVDAIEKGHPSFNPASSTPASDGERVVAYFGSYGLICFDTDGEKLWDLKMPLTKSYAGNATSPIIVGDRVILYRGNYVDHFLLAVDKHTGKELWKVPQTERFTTSMACTSCPVVAENKLIVHSAGAIQAFDVSTGKRVWKVACATTATSTPVLAAGEVVVATWNQTGESSLVPTFPAFDKLINEHDKDGDQLISRDELPRLMVFHRSEGTEAPQNGAPLRFGQVDTNKNGEISAGEWRALREARDARRSRIVAHGILAINIDSNGMLLPKQIRRLESKSIPEVPSPLYHNGLVYFVKNGGVLTCLELKTGKSIYRMRTSGSGTHYSSPIIADGKLFTISGAGRITVLSLGPAAKILATNEMGEPTYATPAVVDGTIYVRTHTRLFAFANQK